VLWKDFKRFATDLTGRVSSSGGEVGRAASTSDDLSPSSRTRKEEGPPDPQRDKVGQGLIAV